jgi:hypothetical protein
MADQAERVILEAEDQVSPVVDKANAGLDRFEKQAESSHGKVIRISLLFPIPRQIRHYVFQFRVADFGLARNGHAEQTVPYHGFDQGGRKIRALFEHRRKLALIFHGKCGGAGQIAAAKHDVLRRHGSVTRSAPFIEDGFSVCLRRRLRQKRIAKSNYQE